MSEEPSVDDIATVSATLQNDVTLLDVHVRRLLAHVCVLLDKAEAWRKETPIDCVLFCPSCGKQHLDVGEFRERVHRKHKCENTPEGEKTGCGHLWVPHWYATRGVTLIDRAQVVRAECGALESELVRQGLISP